MPGETVECYYRAFSLIHLIPESLLCTGIFNERKHGTQYLRGLGELSTDIFLCHHIHHTSLSPTSDSCPFQVPDCPVNYSPLSINQSGPGFLGEVKGFSLSSVSDSL